MVERVEHTGEPQRPRTVLFVSDDHGTYKPIGWSTITQGSYYGKPQAVAICFGAFSAGLRL
jgi:hypothetical protein